MEAEELELVLLVVMLQAVMVDLELVEDINLLPHQIPGGTGKYTSCNTSTRN